MGDEAHSHYLTRLWQRHCGVVQPGWWAILALSERSTDLLKSPFGVQIGRVPNQYDFAPDDFGPPLQFRMVAFAAAFTALNSRAEIFSHFAVYSSSGCSRRSPHSEHAKQCFK